jgi:hypothetical protein
VLFLFLFALLGFATQQEERAVVVKEAGFLQRGKKNTHTLDGLGIAEKYIARHYFLHRSTPG